MSQQWIDYARPSGFRKSVTYGIIWGVAAVIALTSALNALLLYLTAAIHTRAGYLIMLLFGPLADVLLICIFFLLTPVARRLFGGSNVATYLVAAMLAPLLWAGIFFRVLAHIW